MKPQLRVYLIIYKFKFEIQIQIQNREYQCSECTQNVGVDAIVLLFCLLLLLLLYRIFIFFFVCDVPDLLLHGDHAFPAFFDLLQNLELPLP